jgi:hypothetical protein
MKKTLLALGLVSGLCVLAALASDSQTVMEKDGTAEIAGGRIRLKSAVTEQVEIASMEIYGESGPLIFWYPDALIFKSGSTGGAGDKFTVNNLGNVHFQGSIYGGGAAIWSSVEAINPHTRELKGGTWNVTGNLTEGGEAVSRWRGTLTSNPSSPQEGDLFYNSSTTKVRIYAGGAWRDLN